MKSIKNEFMYPITWIKLFKNTQKPHTKIMFWTTCISFLTFHSPKICCNLACMKIAIISKIPNSFEFNLLTAWDFSLFIGDFYFLGFHESTISVFLLVLPSLQSFFGTSFSRFPNVSQGRPFFRSLPLPFYSPSSLFLSPFISYKWFN